MRKHLVLCVDDDPEILAAVGRTLRRVPELEVRPTTSCQDVLAWIASEDVAVLVSDYEMPEMTGAQLAARAKRLRSETVRILLTGRRTLDTAVDGINNGEIFRFISKPFDSALLRTSVLDAVARHEELVALSGDRRRRERAEALRAALEAEYPGISSVQRDGPTFVVTDDPWRDAAELGLAELDRRLERA